MGDIPIIGDHTPRYQYTINGFISWKGLAEHDVSRRGKCDWTGRSSTSGILSVCTGNRVCRHMDGLRGATGPIIRNLINTQVE